MEAEHLSHDRGLLLKGYHPILLLSGHLTIRSDKILLNECVYIYIYVFCVMEFGKIPIYKLHNIIFPVRELLHAEGK